MSNERKHHTPEEKVAILRQHLIDRVPVCTLCDEHRSTPRFSTGGSSSFLRTGPRPSGRRRTLTNRSRPANSASPSWRRS